MLTLTDISYTYPNGTQALHCLNLNFKPGQITAIVGHNGSGKSTLGNIIAQIFTQQQGTLICDHLPITKKIPILAVRQRLGIVFQNPDYQIIFNRVEDDLTFTLENFKIPPSEIPSRITQSLHQVDLAHHLHSDPHQLSLGEKQRLAIANALATSPRYLVLDEVTSMLDAEGKQTIYQLLPQLTEKNIGVIFITNDLEETLYADQIHILHGGRLHKSFSKSTLPKHLSAFTELGFHLPFSLQLLDSLPKQALTEITDLTPSNLLQLVKNTLKKSNVANTVSSSATSVGVTSP